MNGRRSQTDKHTFKAWRHRFEYAFVLGLLPLIWLIPLKSAYQIADFLAWLIFHVFKIRRDVTLNNLARAFPEKPGPERAAIAKRTYVQHARTFVELLRFPKMSPAEIRQSVRIKNLHFADEVAKRGRGAVMVTGHFGNWELLGAAVAQVGWPFYVVAQKQTNDLVNKRLHQYRSEKGLNLIYRGMAVRRIVDLLRERCFVAFVADQDAGKRGVFVNFFGIPSSTHQGAAFYLLKTGVPLIFGVAIRTAPGRFVVESEFLAFDHLKGATEENIRIVTQSFTSLLEKWIRQYPEQYNWMHRRWKSHPPAGG